MKDTIQNRTPELTEIAQNFGLEYESLKRFVDDIIDRMAFDGERLTDLFEPLNLTWKKRVKRELALMRILIPILREKAHQKEIWGIKIYEKHLE